MCGGDETSRKRPRMKAAGALFRGADFITATCHHRDHGARPACHRHAAARRMRSISLAVISLLASRAAVSRPVHVAGAIVELGGLSCADMSWAFSSAESLGRGIGVGGPSRATASKH
jgi:hypothetical protein